MASTILWFLWFARCKRIFRNENESPLELFLKIRKFSLEQISLTEWEVSNIVNDSNEFPFIICAYGSFISEQYVAGIGWTIFEKENPKAARVSPVRTDSPLYTELLAVKAGLEDAVNNDLTNVLILTDTVNAFPAISNMTQPTAELSELTKSCQENLRYVKGRIQWTFRKYLTASDTVAKLARKITVYNYWCNDFSNWLLEFACKL